MKKQHGIHGQHASPRQMKGPPMGRGRRPPPAPMEGHLLEPGEEAWPSGPVESGGPQMPKETPRPVGQVAPAQRSATPKSEHGDTSQRISTPEDRRPPMRGRGRGMHPPGMQRPRPHPNQASSSHHNHGGSGEARPDLQKLGLKFGGSISIGVIDSGNHKSGKRAGAGDGQGVSIQKLKGDVPVGVPMNIRESGTSKSGGGGDSGNSSGSGGSGGTVQQNTSGDTISNVKTEPATVKEEPKDFDGEEVGDGITSRGQNEDEFEDYPEEEEEFEGEAEGVYQEEGEYDDSMQAQEEQRSAKYQNYPQVGEEYQES